MSGIKIYYHLSGYISHRRAGLAYMDCLRALGGAGFFLVEDPGESDVLILHDEPTCYQELLAKLPPRPGRKHIGYAVWETPQLPRPYADGVKSVDAVWTASEFSRAAFAPHVPCFVLPHVALRPKVDRGSLLWARERLGMTGETREERDCFYFYTIIDAVNPRKDIRSLLTAFSRAFPAPGDKVRLVVKQYRKALNLDGIPHVIDIPEMLDDGQIAALHTLCDACVSSHHAESWGLSLSEALCFGNPVIATGYSGNTEFMTFDNSFPVKYTISPVSERMCRVLPRLFSPDMTWADIDLADFARILRQVRFQGVSREFRRRAAESMKAFAPAAVCERLRNLLENG
ncbi:hypothetical protein FACS1894206_04650 [Deltaproteobacteria bacterium]|nr:hypothetical protein FACS1894206_04650 [Deltaproteobacteria bacterium]